MRDSCRWQQLDQCNTRISSPVFPQGCQIDLLLTFTIPPFSMPAKNLLLMVGSNCRAVTPTACKMSALFGSLRSITRISVGVLRNLVSHHFTVPSRADEKNSVLALEVTQRDPLTGSLQTKRDKRTETQSMNAKDLEIQVDLEKGNVIALFQSSFIIDIISY